ncbi:PAS domain S-box protein [Desulfopila aestuarii]|uniref:histidine kinase n=1 Tax=Desulfopila aestuarii DSM 18488 TaxID=1121416 RepID=A0A1M7YK71_9BACT|nr:PAS domain S-box protein [Desulfopila aestuarii]SHO52928.1 PAS domain S-box-containing protein [Desulfopila aestuarii DSM 18488]
MIKPGTSGFLFILLAVLLVSVTYWYYQAQEKSYEQQVENVLMAIATTKSDQIAEWRRERLVNGVLLMGRDSLVADVEHYLHDGNLESMEDTLRRFREIQKIEGFDHIVLTAPDGRLLFATEQEGVDLHETDVAAIVEAVRTRSSVFSDLHLADDGISPVMSVVAPLFTGAGTKNQAVAAVVMDIDVQRVLFPLIASWPVPSETAETLLIRREGDGALFLNELRHQKNTALKLHFSTERKDIPAVMAILGKTGIVRGQDYRGVAVVAALVPIVNSPWVMIAKIDEKEAFAEWRIRVIFMIGFVLIVFGLLFVIFLVITQRTRKEHFRQLYLAENELRAGAEKQAVTLKSIGDAVIATDANGRVELLNPVAERLTGWSQQEAFGKPLREIFVIISEKTREPVDDPVTKVLTNGGIVGLANHTLLISRDGKKIPIADSGAPIVGENGVPTGVVLVFRDQSEERLTERLMDIRLSLIEYATGHDLDQLLTRTLDLIGELVDSPIGFYHFMGDDQKTLILQQWSTRTLREFCHASGKGAHYSVDLAGVWVDCVRERKPVVHNDYEALPHKRGLPEGHAPVMRELVVPVMRDGKIVAIMGVGNKADLYTEKDIDIVSYVADVTWEIVHQRRVEQELIESERRLFTLLGNLPGMAYHCRNDAHWTMEFVSKGCRGLTGYAAEELVDNAVVSYNEIIHPEDRGLVRDGVVTALQEDRPFVLVYRIKTKENELKWVWEQGRVVDNEGGKGKALEGLILDITKRKTAENELQRLLLAVEQTAETIVITNAGGIVQYVNPAFEKITGYSREEILGKAPRILKSGKQDQDFYKEMWQTISSGQTWSGRLVNRKKDGTLFTEDATISPIIDTKGQVTNYVAVKRDITEELHLSQQMQQAQKMEAVGRLAGGVAHDFNNMLAVIIGFAGMALSRVQPADPLHEELTEILTAANRSADITKQLLAFARQQTIAPIILDCNKAIGDMLKMLGRLLGEDIDMVWLPGEGLWPIKLDPVQLDQILANLCINARDAIAEVGKITIETGNVVLTEEYCADHPGAVSGEYVRLVVSDNGQGMDREQLAKIFEPFYTTKGIGKGTGLGLATLFGIVKQNNGFVNVYSEPGVGTTFRIYLPRLDAGEEVIREDLVEQVTEWRGHGERVLVVEDEPVILVVARRMLEELGYRVVTAKTPFEALEIAARHKEEVDLLITDVVMPEMNGRELARRMQELIPSLCCMYMSGYTANVIARHGVLERGVVFLAKPFAKDELARKVREALRQGTKKGINQ